MALHQTVGLKEAGATADYKVAPNSVKENKAKRTTARITAY